VSCPIVAQDVWKSFPMNRDRPGFKEFVLRLPRMLRRGTDSLFWALKGVSFEVRRGECLGVIGRNGAGKSTLLSILLGSIPPTRGSVTVSGRVTPLLSLGAGFHPDLTGRENAVLNGVMLGHTIREMRSRIGAILDFAEIGEFAGMPVRTYSSGMLMRLGFSVAVHTDPRILLIDEVLAVGDQEFQRKSGEELKRLIRGGVTTVLVTHDLGQVKELCDRAVWLEGGEIRVGGRPEEAVAAYLGSSY
jgi:ABC-type polysaccharide/polyol phosphate transport system ATPase subunit